MFAPRSAAPRKRFVPGLEPLEQRAVPIISITAVGSSLMIQDVAPQNPNLVAIHDNGLGRIDVFADGRMTSYGGISTINVNTRSHNDTVRYFLNGPLITPRTLNTELGDGGDTFHAVVKRDLFKNLSIVARGENGADTLKVTANRDAAGHRSRIGIDVAAGATFRADLHGGNGSDVIATLYSGDLDGVLDFYSHGDNDPRSGVLSRDAITIDIRGASGSTGTVGRRRDATRIEAGRDRDTMRFEVRGPSSMPVFARANGQGGSDDSLVRTANVTPENVESDFVIP
jgi:hypothetical protein